VCRFSSSGLFRTYFEKGQQRTWDHIPTKETACGKNQNPTFFSQEKNFYFVEMRNACQVTNQSSHGELSFHHNPHPSALLGLVPLYFSRYSERGHKNETCSSPTYCHCCELCALKQKPGALLAQIHHHPSSHTGRGGGHIRKNPNCRPYSSPHQVPKHKMLWYIEKGTLREVGKLDA